ncbi:MAG TPA: hypothetical protein VD902_01195 [Symbiobacteriaceae bacterium]|nr:hypothetical protein [Symbiobacteriaceae bacterium]
MGAETGVLKFLGAGRLAGLPAITDGPVSPRVIPLRERPAPVDGAVTIQAVPPVGTTGAPPPFTVRSSFEGLRFADTNAAPPDVSIGVGPNHIAETINTILAVFDKSGNLVMAPVSLAAFFTTGDFFVADPKIVFDPLSQRFFMVLIGLNTTTNQGKAWIAASQTDDPTGLWNKYVLTERSDTFPDYPGLGFSSDKITVTANAFNILNSNFVGAEFWAIRKTDLVAGVVAPAMTYFAPVFDYFTVQPAESQTPVLDQFMVAVDTFDFVTLHFFRVTGEPGITPVTSDHTTLAMNDGSFPPDARQLGGPDIDTLDDRWLRATWRDGFLWAAGTGACTPPGDVAPRACPRLMQIQTDPAPVIVQDFSYGVTTFDFYDAAPQTDAAGNLVVVFSRSSAAEFAGLHFAGRLASDPPNTLSGPALLRVGDRSYDCTFCDPNQPERWGDYFHAVVDPVDGSLWVAGEYAGLPTSNDYATFIANVGLPGPTTTTTTTSTTTTTTSTSTTSTSTSTTSTSTSTTSTSTTTPPPRGVGWLEVTCEIEI